MTYITNTAIEVINFVKSKGIEIRFSSEDSFRSGESTFRLSMHIEFLLTILSQTSSTFCPSILPSTKSVSTESVLPTLSE
jgi:isopropylmalate/homocitrate/citramalate synthase